MQQISGGAYQNPSAIYAALLLWGGFCVFISMDIVGSLTASCSLLIGASSRAYRPALWDG